MYSWSDSSIAFLISILQGITSICAGITFVAGVMLIFSCKESARRQELEISKLGKDVAVANARAAQANEKAETEHLARTRLQADILPRRFIETGLTVKELSFFSGIHVRILCGNIDMDGWQFSGILASVLERAKWHVGPIEISSQGRPQGVLVCIKKPANASAQAKLWDAATVLVYQLRDNGIAASVRMEMQPYSKYIPADLPSDTIAISVGAKPQFYLSDAILMDYLERTDPSRLEEYRKIREEQEEVHGPVGDSMTRNTPEDTARKEAIVEKYTNPPQEASQ